eukprot:PhF_6_TR10612/c0_g1_i1/m.17118
MSAWCPSTNTDWVEGLCRSRDAIKHFKSHVGFSQCFEDAALLGGIHFIMLLALIGYLTQSHTLSSRAYNSPIHVTMAVISTAMAIQYGVLLVERLSVSPAVYEIIGYGCALITWMTLCTVLYQNIRVRLFSLTLDIRCLLLMAGAPIIIRLRTVGILYDAETTFYVVCNVLAAILVFILWVIALFHWPEKLPVYENIGEDRVGKGPPNPYTHASWFSKMWYLWFDPLLRIGYSRQLVASDVYELEPGMFTEEVRDEFHKAWEAEVKKKGKDASVLHAVWNVYKWELFLSMMWKACYDGASFGQPLLLNALLLWIQQASPSDSNCPGYVMATLMVLVTFMLPILENSYFYVVYRTGQKSRSALTDAVQRKALRIHPRARDEIGTGAIVNHMTIDAEMLEWVFNSMNYLWSAPIRIGIALYLLYESLGYASFVGFASLLVVFPLQGAASVAVRNCRRKAMAFSDERVKSMTELINGIRIVKFYTWEKSSLKRIFDIRTKELAEYLKVSLLNSVNITLFNLNPVILAVVVFSVRSVYANLSANEAFTALSLLNIIRFPLMMLPGSISSVIEATVSLRRLSRFLTAEEVTEVASSGAAKGTVKLTNATIEYKTAKKEEKKEEGEEEEKKDGAESKKDETQSPKAEQTKEEDRIPFALKDITLELRPGTLTCIIGRTGSGKSTLLSGLVGDIELKQGKLTVDGTVSYIAQQAWITNDTVEGNILFGSDLDRAKLASVIHACQLELDIESWTGGLQQEIGEKGLNLSGGQKQRVAIARATYAESDIVLLDDPLSALDARVGRLLFDECVAGVLRDRTRVLVTNQLQYLERADWVVMLDKGTVVDQGTYGELNSRSDKFKEFTQHSKQSAVDDLADGADKESKDAKDPKKKKKSGLATAKSDADDKEEGRLVDDEHRQEGTTLTWNHIRKYSEASGGLWVIAVLLLFCLLGQFASVGSNWWLAEWSGQEFNISMGWWVAGYGLFGVAQAITDLVTSAFTAKICNRGAETLHNNMLKNLVNLPMAFFDANPSGRILNRVTKDQGGIDDGMMFQINLTLKCVFGLFGTVGAIALATPLFLVVALPVLFAFYWIQLYYRCSVREMKRLESITRSPIYTFFGETLSGVSLIRAFHKQPFIMSRLSHMLDHNQKFVLAEMAANRWLNMRLEGLGVIVVGAVSYFTVSQRVELGADLVGFALSYAFTITGVMSIIIFVYSGAEQSFTSVERVLEYSELPIENVTGSMTPATSWPPSGEMKFEGVEMGYRSNSPAVLKGVTFDVKAGEKVGVVGRTGAGKSSMFLALYRMVELRRGKITIDGVDISKLDLERLRSSLAIIPQDPVVFGGTIRSNLDPFNKHSDAELNLALTRAHLEDIKLDDEITESGGNLSVGQRQLLCLARALLVESKILVLDEATASVDPMTDRLVQETIQKEFKGRTILVIAHRIQTVLDANRILVLDHGEVSEFGTPAELVQGNGIFRSFIDQYGSEAPQMIEQITAQAKK